MEQKAYREEKRKVEYIDGVAYMMAPAGTVHNSIGGNLYRIISNFLRGKRCKLFYETKVVLDEKNHFIPDLLVVCDRNKIKENYVEGAPDFVVEILSLSTRKRDLSSKRDTYERFGVKEYWIIDPKSKTVDVYVLQNGRYTMTGSHHPYTETEWEGLDEEEKEEALLPLKLSLYDDLVIDVKEVFED